MNFQLRTNEPLRIDQLMTRALNSFQFTNEQRVSSVNNGAFSRNLEVEGGGPVRPAVRVPYSPSHYLSDQHNGGGDTDRAGTADPAIEVVAA